MEDDFYIQLEDKHRGSRELIKSRMKVYLPFLNLASQVLANKIAVDLGCGRGEWLELLQEIGWQATGVDINQGMVDYCKSLGLDALHEDIITYLRSRQSDSIAVISGFHLAEHLPFETLLELAREAHRIIIPGGLLILETPNPENIMVSTTTFYIDPTHQRPIPSQLLSFITQYFGFTRTKILRLQEFQRKEEDNVIDLLQVLTGVSQDIAIIAQKSASPYILSAFDQEFNKEYGVTLEALANKYSVQVEAMNRTISNDINQIKNILAEELQRLKNDLANIQMERNAIQAELQSLNSDYKRVLIEKDSLVTRLNNVNSELSIALSQRDEFWTELDRLSKSKSYRITKPLRVVTRFLRNIPTNYQHTKKSSRSLLFSIIHKIRMMPIFSPFANIIKTTNPILWSKVRDKMLNAQSSMYGDEYIASFTDNATSLDEQYFTDLFQREINKKKHSAKD